MRSAVLTLATLCSALCLAPFAVATTFIDVPFPDLVKDTPTIVRGKIGNHHADWVLGEEASKRIYTFYDLQLAEGFKGSTSGDTVVIREMGGEKDGVGMQVSGAAQFSQGEDVVLLLGERNKDGSFDVRGLSSGKFNLKRQEDGTECLLGMGIQDPEKDGGQVDPAQGCRWNISSLRKLVREQVDASKRPDNSVPLLSPAPSRLGIQGEKGGPLNAASQLQPSSQDALPRDAGDLSFPWVLILLSGAVVLLLIGVLLKKMF